MRPSKRYLKRVLRKRLIEFILMFSVISIVLFGIFMVEARSDTGILYQQGDNWYIDSNYGNNHNHYYTNFGIRNPHSFPHILIPENNETEVHYVYSTRFPFIDTLPLFVYVFTLDLVPIFIIKQFILHIFIAVSSFAVFIYLFLNRKRFQFTDKL